MACRCPACRTSTWGRSGSWKNRTGRFAWKLVFVEGGAAFQFWIIPDRCIDRLPTYPTVNAVPSGNSRCRSNDHVQWLWLRLFFSTYQRFSGFAPAAPENNRGPSSSGVVPGRNRRVDKLNVCPPAVTGTCWAESVTELNCWLPE